jgi:hypothetical protein
MTRDAIFHVTRRRTERDHCLCDPTEERLPPRSRWQRIGGEVRAAFRRDWRCTNCGGTITTIVHMSRAA